MLDLRLAAPTLAILIALMSVSLANGIKDNLAKEETQPVAQSSVDARPIRVILPAPWEPSEGQAKTQSMK